MVSRGDEGSIHPFLDVFVVVFSFVDKGGNDEFYPSGQSGSEGKSGR